MFVRIIKGRTREYAVIIRGYRDKAGKVRHKTVQNLGVVTDKNREELLALGRQLISHREEAPYIRTGQEIDEVSRQNWGAPAVVAALWQRFELDTVLGSKAPALQLLLADRWLSPSSKQATYHKREAYLGGGDVTLQELYRAMDYLAQHQDALKAHLLHQQRHYGPLDVVLFDVTTLYFESQRADELRAFGYSKDGKAHEVQVVLSVVVSKEGCPLTYEIFSGNTSEGHTLLPVLSQLRERMAVGNVILVADRGIGSLDNLEALTAHGFEYVMGARLRCAGQQFQQEAIDPKGFTTLAIHDDPITCRYKWVTHPKHGQWVILWSNSRAQKDAQDRQRLVEKAQDMLATGKGKGRRGAQKYLKGTSVAYQGLDDDKIALHAQFDGFYALSVNGKNLSAAQVAATYHQLWRIEETFRTLKTFFDIRPLSHWTPRRIQGHILFTFIVLVLENHLLLSLQKTSEHPVSHDRIRHALTALQCSLLSISGQSFVSYARLDPLQSDILASLHIPIPRNHPAP